MQQAKRVEPEVIHQDYRDHDREDHAPHETAALVFEMHEVQQPQSRFDEGEQVYFGIAPEHCVLLES